MWLYLLTVPVLCLAALEADVDYVDPGRSGRTQMLAAVAGCEGADGACAVPVCDAKCQCDKLEDYFFDETTGECVLSAESNTINANSYINEGETENEHSLETKIREQDQRVVSGVIVSAILFVSCAATCVLVAGLYCLRMSHDDRKLKGDLRALAKKQGRRVPVQPPARPVPRYPPVADACTVIVEDAGVCVL